ncbi:agmatinase [Streptomyces sp. NPDC059816]|uniref:agmatinase n=1 Tax=Streptomyces sp. NPDC059816 TaxID=3346960 RepID=UPI003658627E
MNSVEPPIGPPDASASPRYAGLATFARLPRLEDVPRADIAVVGVPFDSGVSYRPGARFGPAHIREASRLLRPYNPAQDVEPFAAQQIADAGGIAANPFSLDEAVTQIHTAARELTADGTRLLTLGGDHTIALPLLRAVAERHGPVAVLHFDAHLDTWDTYFGAPVTHGTPFRRASEEGLIDLTASLHVGTRGPLYSRQDLRDDERLGFAVISSPEIEAEGLARAIERMLDRLGDRPVYLSIDIDVLDPAHAPGTGTPEAGGMTSRELLAMIRALRAVRLVGADVVEVAPAYDHAQLTAVAAAHAAYEILSAMTPDHLPPPDARHHER